MCEIVLFFGVIFEMINYLSFLNEYCFYLVSLKFDSKFNGLMVKIIF